MVRFDLLWGVRVMYCDVCSCMLCCIVLQWDVVCNMMFSAVLYRALYAVWYCVVRFAEI